MKWVTEAPLPRIITESGKMSEAENKYVPAGKKTTPACPPKEEIAFATAA